MRPLRHALPGGLHEISIRVTGEHLLLKPAKALNNMVLGIIGRAQLQEDVKVHAFVVLSNHYHSQHPLTHELAKVQTNQHTAMVSGMFQTYCLGLSKIASFLLTTLTKNLHRQSIHGCDPSAAGPEVEGGNGDRRSAGSTVVR